MCGWGRGGRRRLREPGGVCTAKLCACAKTAAAAPSTNRKGGAGVTAQPATSKNVKTKLPLLKTNRLFFKLKTNQWINCPGRMGRRRRSEALRLVGLSPRC